MRLITGRVGAALRRPLGGRLGAGNGAFFVLSALSALGAVLRLLSGTTGLVPLAGQVGPLIAGGLLLSLNRLRQLLVVVAVGVIVDLSVKGLTGQLVPSLIVVVLSGALAYWLALQRDRLGLADVRSDDMLIELRDRLRSQGEIPPLGAGWHLDTVMRSADAAAFAGDFLTARSYDRDGSPTLELALVDVSGKGVAAGTRALLLSGALGGLLGAVPPARFLEEANSYVLRQEWREGFATAVHLTVNLSTGSYCVESAGHPPAVQLHAGSGRWEVSDSEGPLLGVLPVVSYQARAGQLGPGDALLLYTDGVVERAGRDLSVGIDRLIGGAERLLTRGGFAGGAGRLLDDVAPDGSDDRALVLLWRDAH